MIITRMEYFPYCNKLKTPLHTAKNTINERCGLHVKLTVNNRFSAFGDVTPLPEYGSESLEQAKKILNNHCENFNSEINSLDDLEKLLLPFKNYPAARHGVEQALINSLAADKNCSLYDLFGCEWVSSDIKVNSVIGMLPVNETIKTASAHFNNGFRTIKLKFGRKDFHDDIKCIKELQDNFGNDLNIRIDINGSWNFKEAIEKLKLLEEYNPEFVEQPCSTTEELIRLAKETNIPVAADESVRNFTDAVNFIEDNSIKVLVLKPMMLGGIYSVKRIIDKAELKDVKIVISSSFESILGRKMLVFLTSLIKENIAHGLGTEEYFWDGYEMNSFPVKNGFIRINNVYEIMSIERNV